MTSIEGILPVVPMPFQEDGEIDLDELARIVTFVAAKTVAGVAFGLASEFHRLTDAERETAIRTAAGVLGGRPPLVASIQADSTTILLRRGEAAVRNGASTLMVTLPSGGPIGVDAFAEHFDTASRRLDVSLIIQDVPAAGQGSLPPTTLAAVANAVPSVVAVKTEVPPTAPRVSELVAALAPRIAVLGGAGGVEFANELDRGARGGMPGVALIELFLEVHRLHGQGEHELARRLFHAMLPLLIIGGRDLDTFCYVDKWLLRRRGLLRSCYRRPPLRAGDPDLDRELERVLHVVAQGRPEFELIGLGEAVR